MTLQRVMLDKYLEDTVTAIDPTYRLPLQQQHCKSMIRTLLGLSAAEFDQNLRDLKTERQWMATESFVGLHGDALAEIVSSDDAPQFSKALEELGRFRERPDLFFSSLARGRVYQGNFERLLLAVKPELVEEYQDIFREISEADTLRVFVHEKTGDVDEDTRCSLMTCLEVDYAAKPSQPADGGKSSGKQGECDLFSYLEATLGDNHTLQILAPVWIIRQSKKPISKRCEYALELPGNFDLHGMTSELDAVVVEIDDSTARLVQAWEAKATLNPPSLNDAMLKKGRIVQAIMENESTLIVRGQRFRVEKGTPPRLGIFGTRIFSPVAAAGKTQTVISELALQRDPTVVRNALETGYVSVERERVAAYIEDLRRLARTMDPVVLTSNEVAEESS